MESIKDLLSMAKDIKLRLRDDVLLVATYYPEPNTPLIIPPSHNNRIITKAYVIMSECENYKPGDIVLLSEFNITEIDFHVLYENKALPLGIRIFGIINVNDIIGNFNENSRNRSR